MNPTIVHAFNENTPLNAIPLFRAIIFIWTLQVAYVNKIQGQCNIHISSFEHRDGQMGGSVILMTRQISMVGWCLVGIYLGGY
jgi:hypothetical protein